MSRRWSICHIDLTDALPALSVENGAAGCYAVFWAHDVPLGHCFIAAGELPLTPAMLRERALHTVTSAIAWYLSGGETPPDGPDALREAALLHEEAAPPHEAAPHRAAGPLLEAGLPTRPLDALKKHLNDRPRTAEKITTTVVVCTRDRPDQLARCLRSLRHLTPSPSEIIVVDNAPQNEATRELVAQMPDVEYVLEPRPGLDVARNTGILHSSGDIVAFADDDVVVHPRWLARLCQGFRSAKVMAVMGLVLPAELETKAQLIFERHWGFNRGYRPRLYDDEYFARAKPAGVPAWEIGAGASMAFRRAAFDAVGGFDERLDVGAAGCSGDSELWYRLLAEGWHCRYEPSAVAYHTHRRRMDDLQRQLFNYMRGHTAALLVQYERYGHTGNLRRLLLSLPTYYARLLAKGVTDDMRGRRSTLWSEIAGCLSGIAFYLRHRRTPHRAARDVAARDSVGRLVP
jgi:GT2 family glycosyltransferase